jgi:hypothetical protein
MRRISKLTIVRDPRTVLTLPLCTRICNAVLQAATLFLQRHFETIAIVIRGGHLIRNNVSGIVRLVVSSQVNRAR